MAVQLLPTADADTEQNAPTTNSGTSTTLRVADDTVGKFESFISFDISGVGVVGTSILTLNGGLITPTDPANQVGVFGGQSTTWSESTITFNTRPGSTGGSLATDSVTAVQAYTFDVTSYVQARKTAGDSTIYFVLRSVNTGAPVSFSSREVTGAEPTLDIDDTDSVAPTAAVTAPDITAVGVTPQTVTVVYSDNVEIDTTTIDTSDIVVSGPGGNRNVSSFIIDPSDPKNIIATYTVDAPSGGWSSAVNGNFTITVQSGQVKDLGGNNATGTGSFAVAIDSVNPTAGTLVAPALTTGGGTTYSFSIPYTDDVALNGNSIGVNDVTVTGPGGPLTVTSATKTGSGTSFTATYTVAAPGGTWDDADNGTYTVSVATGEVRDLAGNAVLSGGGTFTVTVPTVPPPPPPPPPPPSDVTAPRVTNFVGNAITTAGSAVRTISVTYTDETAFDGTTIDADDLVITRQGGGAAPTVASVTKTGSGGVFTAVYTLAPVGGTWDATDNGIYNVGVVAGQLADIATNAIAGGTAGTFTVAIDTTPPSAVVNAANVTAGGATTYNFTVNYTDNVAINATTIGINDVVVTRISDGSTLTVLSVTKTGTGGSITATYAVAVPGGSWDISDNGGYAIAVAAGAVTDTAGNLSTAAAGAFQVTVPDQNSPGVEITPIGAITTAGVTRTEVTVVYTDAQGINVGTIDSGDVTVVRDGGSSLVVTLVSTTPSTNAASITAIYSISAPGGFWNSADNGGYTLSIAPGAVQDTSGNGTLLAGAAFEVDIQSTVAVVDSNFNGGNPIRTGFVAESLTTDTSGRILIAGRQGDRAAGSSQSVLQRLNDDGSLDTFFGEGGQIIADPGSNDGFYAVTMDARLRIVAAGFRGGELEIMRFDTKGRPDKKFGQSGIALADWGAADDTIFAVTVLANGRILVAGTSGGQFALAQFDDKGNIDGSFGVGGAKVFRPGTDNSVIGALVVKPDGIIYAAGTMGTSVVALRMDGAGNLDGTFGVGGVLTVTGLDTRTDLPYQDHSVGLAIAADGKFLIANRVPTVGTSTSSSDFGIARFNINGTIDSAFGGGDGIAEIDFGGTDDADFVAVQGSGQILVAGTTDAGAGVRLAVATLNPDGTLDGEFSAGGKFTTESAVSGAVGSSPSTLIHVTGVVQGNGQLLVTESDALGNPTSSPLRRLVTPGTGTIGDFGTVGGKTVKLVFTDADGTRITASMKGGGSGRVFYDGTAYDLVFTGTGVKSTVSFSTKSGNGRMVLRDLRTDGSVKSISGKKSDVIGTVYVAGEVAKLEFGTLVGVIGAAGNLASLSISGAVTSSTILAGTNFGTDGKIGGTGGDQDLYGGAKITKFSVSGPIAGTFVGAGVNPVNSVRGDTDDLAVGGVASLIGSITAKKGVDAGTIFAAGAISKAKVPKSVKPAEDSHFKILPA